MEIGDAVKLKKAQYVFDGGGEWRYIDTLGVITDSRRLAVTGVEQYRVYTMDGKHDWELPADLRIVNKDLTD